MSRARTKQFRVNTSAASVTGGRVFLIEAIDVKHALAWFAMNYGLSHLDVNDVKEASVDDLLHYQNLGGRVHQATGREYGVVLSILQAVDETQVKELSDLVAQRTSERDSLQLQLAAEQEGHKRHSDLNGELTTKIDLLQTEINGLKFQLQTADNVMKLNQDVAAAVDKASQT